MAGVQGQVSPCSPFTQSRRSGRLREKSLHCFSLPSREEVFETIASDDKTPSKHYSHLRPRKLINNFIKERNSYNNPDGISLFDENSDEEFINDKLSSDEESDEESSAFQEGSNQNSDSIEEERGRTGGRLRSRRGFVKSLPPRRRISGMDDEDSDEELAAPLRTKKQRRQLEQSSSSEEENSQDNSSPVKRKKRHPKVSIQSDGSTSEEEESPSNLNEDTTVPETHQSEEDEQNFNQFTVSAIKLHQSEGRESDGSFIATSDSSDNDIPDFDDWERDRSSKPTHEELICNYRQRKSRAARQSQHRKRQRICLPSSSSSSDNEESREDGPQSGDRMERPPSKRAESLSSKKKAWKSETLGRYKEERERRLSERKDTYARKI